MANPNCTECGRSVMTIGAKNCTYCGHPLPAMLTIKMQVRLGVLRELSRLSKEDAVVLLQALLLEANK